MTNKIVNASSIKIGSNGLPNMSQTITGWFQTVTFGVVSSEVVDYEKVETITNVTTKGVVQPYKPEALEIQTAGVRSWSWLMIHCLPDLQLQNNEYLYYKDVKYKVLQRNDYTEYGYLEYIVCQTFTGE